MSVFLSRISKQNFNTFISQLYILALIKSLISPAISFRIIAFLGGRENFSDFLALRLLLHVKSLARIFRLKPLTSTVSSYLFGRPLV